MTTLNSCVVSKRILDQVEADIDECISSKTFLDLQSSLPSVFIEEDFKMILDNILTSHKQKQVLILGTFVISTNFIENLSKPCEDIIDEKAKNAVDSGKYQQYQMDLQLSNTKVTVQDTFVEETKVDKREERRRKAAGEKFESTICETNLNIYFLNFRR